MPRQEEDFSMWFDYPDDPDKGRVEIRHLDDEDIAQITAKATATRIVFDPKLEQPVREQTIDQLVDRQETAVKAVVNWEKFFGRDGKPMKCNGKNKRKWACNNQFMIFLGTSRKAVAVEAEKRRVEQRKNS